MEETRPVLSSLNKAILKDVLSSLPESRRKPGRTSSAWWWSGRHRSVASSRWTEPWRSGWADSRPAWANYELWTAESPITPRRCTLPTVLCSSAARCPPLTTSPASATGPSRQWTRYRGRKRRRIAPRRFLWKRTWENRRKYCCLGSSKTLTSSPALFLTHGRIDIDCKHPLFEGSSSSRAKLVKSGENQ